MSVRQRGGPSAVRALDDDRRGKPTSERRGRREECTAGVGHSEERTGDVFGAAPPRDQIGECVPSREARTQRCPGARASERTAVMVCLGLAVALSRSLRINAVGVVWYLFIW